MGAYSRKDMVEFAKFAKSWQTPRNVERAYEMYQKGYRLVHTGFKVEVMNVRPKETVTGRGQHADWERELSNRR